MSSKCVLGCELAKVVAECAAEGCFLIHQASNEALVKYKAGDDPVTQVDHTVQKALAQRIYEKFPEAKIVGEESIDEYMVLEHLIKDKSEERIDAPFSEWAKSDLTFDPSELCFFIDPLDCTRGFISNKKWECTVLIGVVYHGTPICGAIGEPYRCSQQLENIYAPTILLGGTILNSPSALEITLGTSSAATSCKSLPVPIISVNTVAVSSRRGGKFQESVAETLGLGEVQIGGSGSKIALVIRGKVGAAMFINSPTSTWDSCAGQAIVRGMGGFMLKPDLSDIEYDWSKEDQTNFQGFICGLSAALEARVRSSLH